MITRKQTSNQDENLTSNDTAFIEPCQDARTLPPAQQSHYNSNKYKNKPPNLRQHAKQKRKGDYSALEGPYKMITRKQTSNQDENLTSNDTAFVEPCQDAGTLPPAQQSHYNNANKYKNKPPNLRPPAKQKRKGDYSALEGPFKMITRKQTSNQDENLTSNDTAFVEPCQDARTLPSAQQSHYDEWTKGSGISEKITRKCLRSLDDHKMIAEFLGWKGYPQHNPLGWTCLGINLLTFKPSDLLQFKPDIPIQFPDQEKPAKYLTSKKGYDALVLSVRDWQAVIEDPTFPVTATEGPKKTGALETCDYAALGLPGVDMGLNKNGRLVPNLEAIAAKGRPINICFDADIQTKVEVQEALIRLATGLKKKECLVYVVPPWDLSLGKGIDDVLANHGPEKVHEIMNTAIPYKQWLQGLERQFKPEKSKTQKIPPADLIARDIAEEYRSTLAFNNQSGLWMRYEADSPGVWSVETNEYTESIISTILDAKGIVGYGSNGYVTNILKKLRHLLIVRKWIEQSPSELIPFQNGVLELATGKLLEHSPGYRFTWSMPREHNPIATEWTSIQTFLNTITNGNVEIQNLLLCFCNAVLKGRSDLQKFLHLTGPGGSGKGTFTRLLTDLIGQTNTHTSTLEDWCGNRFETANAYQKRLIAFPDEDKKVGNLGRFKSLTGEDFLRAEEKGQKAFQFKYEGMVVLISNFPIFAGDSSSGLTRRTILVPFTHVPKPGDRRNLNKDFQIELSAFTNYLLSLPDDFVTATLLGTNEIKELNQEFWASRQRTDSIAAWLNDCVIYDPNASTPIGCDRNEWKERTPITLYGSYCHHAQQSGNQAKSVKNFSPDLLELCNTILGWPIQKVTTRNGKFIQGLRLRVTGINDHIPTYEAQLEASISNRDGFRDGLVTDFVTAGNLDIQGCDGCDGLNQLLSEEKESEFIPQESEKTEIVVTDSDPLPVIPITLDTEQAVQPSPDPSPDSSSEPSPNETDFSTFPHLTSNDYRAKEKRANLIKETMLSCGTCEELTQFKLESDYGESQIAWVYTYGLTASEKAQINSTANTSQPSLDLFFVADDSESVPTFETFGTAPVIEVEMSEIPTFENHQIVQPENDHNCSQHLELSKNETSFAFDLGDRGHIGQRIKDKLGGKIYTIESVKDGRYGCNYEDGSWTSISFADALTNIDPDEF